MNQRGLTVLSVAGIALLRIAAVVEAQQPHPHIVPPVPTPHVPAIDAPQLHYSFVRGPQPPEGHAFGNVSAVGVLPNGNVVVYNRNPQIMMVEYDSDGNHLRTFNPNISGNTHGLRIDPYGNIWITDNYYNVIWKLDSMGEPLMMMGDRGENGGWTEREWNGMFNQPLDLNWDEDDNIYVVQGHGGTAGPMSCSLCPTYSNIVPPVPHGSDPRIIKLDKDGNFLKSRAIRHEDHTYGTIHTVIVTSKGEVWLSDRQENKIIVLDRELNLLREIQQPVRTSGLFVGADGQIWMTAGMDGMVMQLDEHGKIIGWIGEPGRVRDPDSNLIGEAHYMTVTPDGQTIYVADSINAKVHRLERN
jgi:DNA-binding beta-propeller fold protein YncE